MKKIIILLGFVLSVCAIQAQTNQSTPDHLTISELTLDPGGKYGTLTISLSGTRKYTSFGFDLHLPDGLEFDPSKTGNWQTAIQSNVANYSIYPFVEDEREGTKTYSHNLYAEKQSDGALRITTLSGSSDDFLATSGALVKVYIKALTYTKPGPSDIQISGCYFTTSSGVQYNAENQTISDKVSVSTSATGTLRVSSAAHWGTCILPFETSLPGDVKAYSCNSTDDDNSNLILTRVAKMEAYTPYILYSENGYDGSVTGTVDVTKYPEEDGFIRDGYLCGAITKQVICGENYYVLQSLNSVVQFYKANNGNYTINPGKCWIDLSSANSQRVNGYGFMVDELTEIKPIQNQGHSEVYGLDGRRVNNMASGHLYIENGRKIFKK